MIINGTDLRVYFEGNPIAYATNCSLKVNTAEFIEVAADSIAGDAWTEYIPRKLSATVDFSALYAESDDNSVFEDVLSELRNRSSFTVVVTGPTRTFTGTAYVQNLTLNAPVGQPANWTGQFLISGNLVPGAA